MDPSQPHSLPQGVEAARRPLSRGPSGANVVGAAAVAGSRPRVTSPQSVSGRPTLARSSFLGHPQRVDSALGRGAPPVGSDGASCPICLPQEGGTPRAAPGAVSVARQPWASGSAASPSPSFLRPRRGRTPGRASVGPRRPGLRGRACRGALVPSPPSEEAPGEPRTGGVAAWSAALWPAHEATPPQTLGRRATSHCPVHEHLTVSCTQQFKRSWCLSLSVRRCPPCPERLPWALTGTPGAASGAAQEAAALR